MLNMPTKVQKPRVAPRVGAWIETGVSSSTGTNSVSHPEWVRGLKLPRAYTSERTVESHPEWVRGLKHRCDEQEH